MSGPGPGHTVLVVPVPAVEGFVRARTAHYDDSFVSTDPGFVHAHLTLLGPWVDQPTEADLRRVGRIVAAVPAFDYRLAEVRAFPDGVLYLHPEPDAPFRRLAARLAGAFPQCPPYGGAFPGSPPHVTLDRRAPGIDEASVSTALGIELPASAQAERVDLQWWANHDCRVLASWRLP